MKIISLGWTISDCSIIVMDLLYYVDWVTALLDVFTIFMLALLWRHVIIKFFTLLYVFSGTEIKVTLLFTLLQWISLSLACNINIYSSRNYCLKLATPLKIKRRNHFRKWLNSKFVLAACLTTITRLEAKQNNMYVLSFFTTTKTYYLCLWNF